MKRLVFALLAALSFAAPAAFAGGTWTNVSVLHLTAVTSDAASPYGYFEVQFSAASTNWATCAASNKTYATINVSEPGGALMAGMLAAAYTQGSTVTVTAYGTGTCTYNSTVEALAQVNQ